MKNNVYTKANSIFITDYEIFFTHGKVGTLEIGETYKLGIPNDYFSIQVHPKDGKPVVMIISRKNARDFASIILQTIKKYE